MEIFDLITDEEDHNVHNCFNIRGTNGSGKTSIARSFIDKYSQEIYVKGLKKCAYTYSITHNMLLIGTYRNKCGGCDTLVGDEIKALLRLAWMTRCDILFEGVLVSDSKQPYYQLMSELNKTVRKRLFGFIYLDLPVEVCLKRIYERNGGKPIKEDLVIAKHRNMLRYREWQSNQPDCIVEVVKADRPLEDVCSIVKSIFDTTGLVPF